jgi:hypothetical protein
MARVALQLLRQRDVPGNLRRADDPAFGTRALNICIESPTLTLRCRAMKSSTSSCFCNPMSRGTRSGGSADTADWGKSADTAVAAASGAADASQSRLVRRLVKSIGGNVMSCGLQIRRGILLYLSCDGIVSIPFALPPNGGI